MDLLFISAGKYYFWTSAQCVFWIQLNQRLRLLSRTRLPFSTLMLLWFSNHRQFTAAKSVNLKASSMPPLFLQKSAELLQTVLGAIVTFQVQK